MTNKKKPTKAQTIELAAKLIAAMPETQVLPMQTVATAMLTGYNLGKQTAAQGA